MIAIIILTEEALFYHRSFMNKPEYANWPVPASGLSERIVNCAQSAKIQTIGELVTTPAESLLKIRHFGMTSLQQLNSFIQLLDRADRIKDDLHPLPLSEIFDLFLDDDQYQVLALRYGLDEKIEAISRKHSTLQKVANQTGRTRERIRQVEELGLQNLSSRGAQYCLLPYYRHIRSTLLNSLQGTTDLQEIVQTYSLTYTGNLHPASLMLLLFDLNASFFTFFKGLFSILKAEHITEMEHLLTHTLQNSKRPLTLPKLHHVVTDKEGFGSYSPDVIRKALLKLSETSSELGLTRKESLCFHFTSSTPDILLQILKNNPKGGLHYKEITRQFNDLVIPESRKGCGFILNVLQNPVFAQKSSAIYETSRRPDS